MPVATFPRQALLPTPLYDHLCGTAAAQSIGGPPIDRPRADPAFRVEPPADREGDR